MSLAFGNRYFLRKVGLAGLLLLVGLAVVLCFSGEAEAEIWYCLDATTTAPGASYPPDNLQPNAVLIYDDDYDELTITAKYSNVGGSINVGTLTSGIFYRYNLNNGQYVQFSNDLVISRIKNNSSGINITPPATTLRSFISYVDCFIVGNLTVTMTNSDPEEQNAIDVTGTLTITGGTTTARGTTNDSKAGNGIRATNLTLTGSAIVQAYGGASSIQGNGIFVTGELTTTISSQLTGTGGGSNTAGGAGNAGNGIWCGTLKNRGTITGNGGTNTSGSASGNGVYAASASPGNIAGNIIGNGGGTTTGGYSGNGVYIGSFGSTSDSGGNDRASNITGKSLAGGHAGATSGNGVAIGSAYLQNFGLAIDGTGAESCTGSNSGNGVYFGGDATLPSKASPITGYAKAVTSAGVNFSGLANGVYFSGSLNGGAETNIMGYGAAVTGNHDTSGNGILVTGAEGVSGNFNLTGTAATGSGVTVTGSTSGNGIAVTGGASGNVAFEGTAAAGAVTGNTSGNGVIIVGSGSGGIRSLIGTAATGTVTGSFSGNGVAVGGGPNDNGYTALKTGIGSIRGVANKGDVSGSDSGNGVFIGGDAYIYHGVLANSSLTTPLGGKVSGSRSGNGVYIRGDLTFARGERSGAYIAASIDAVSSRASLAVPDANVTYSSNGIVVTGNIIMSNGAVLTATGGAQITTGSDLPTDGDARYCGNGIVAEGEVVLDANITQDEDSLEDVNLGAPSTITGTGGDGHATNYSGNGIVASSLKSKDNWKQEPGSNPVDTLKPNSINAVGGTKGSDAPDSAGLAIYASVTVDVLLGSTTLTSEGDSMIVISSSNQTISVAEWNAWTEGGGITATAAERTGPEDVSLTIKGPDSDVTYSDSYKAQATIWLPTKRADQWNIGTGGVAFSSTNKTASPILMEGIDTTGTIRPLAIISIGDLRLRTTPLGAITISPVNYFLSDIEITYFYSSGKPSETKLIKDVNISPAFDKYDPKTDWYTLAVDEDVQRLLVVPKQFYGNYYDISYATRNNDTWERDQTTNKTGYDLGSSTDIIITPKDNGSPAKEAPDIKIEVTKDLITNGNINSVPNYPLANAIRAEWNAHFAENVIKGNYEVRWYMTDDEDIDETKDMTQLVTPHKKANEDRALEVTATGLSADKLYYFYAEIWKVGGTQAIIKQDRSIRTARSDGEANMNFFVPDPSYGDVTLEAQVNPKNNCSYKYTFTRKEEGGSAAATTLVTNATNNLYTDRSTLKKGTQYTYTATVNEFNSSTGAATGREPMVASRTTTYQGTLDDDDDDDPNSTGDLDLTITGLTTTMDDTEEQTPIIQAAKGSGSFEWSVVPSNIATITAAGGGRTAELKIAPDAETWKTSRKQTFVVTAIETAATASGKNEDGSPRRLTGALQFSVTINDTDDDPDPDPDPDPNNPSGLTITPPSNTTGLSTTADTTLTYTASGGKSPYTWTLSNESTGLSGKVSVDSGGKVTVKSGVAAGTHTFDLTVTDSTSPTKLTYRQNFSIVVGAVSPSPSARLTSDAITITGVPANNTMYVGDKMTLTPTLASGLTRSTSKWEYDTAYFTLSAAGEVATFTAKKAGTTQILYTVTDSTGATATKTINVTILPRVGLPQTGQDDRAATAMLWIGAALLLIAPFAERIKTRVRGWRTRAKL